MGLLKITETLGLQILIFIGLTVITGAIAILFNLPISMTFILLGLAGSIAYSVYFFLKEESKYRILYIVGVNVLFFVILIFGVFISGKNYDISWDGQAYHQEAIINLQEGWNPLYDEELENEIWINHYAKGSWYFSASLYDLLGEIEYTKAHNFLYLVSAFMLGIALLLRLNISKGLSILIALCATANPVAINQIFSFYVDGQLATLVLVLITLLTLNHLNKSIIYNLTIVITLVLLINIKFTALGYALIICMLPFILNLYDAIFNKKEKGIVLVLKNTINLKSTYPIFVGVILAVLIVGFNPYITNTLDHKHPFYPLSGPDKVDIMTYNTPVGLQDKNILEQIYISIFSESSNALDSTLSTKLPFSVSLEELKNFAYVDIRIGGLGPLFGGILILSVAGFLIWNNSFISRNNMFILILLLLIGLTVLINPEAWWARYVPQLWLVPIIVLVGILSSSRNYFKLFFCMAMSLVIIINSVATHAAFLKSNSTSNQLLQVQLDTLEQYSKTDKVAIYFNGFKSNRIRLEENNINFVVSIEDSCAEPINLEFSQAKLCIENKELYQQLYDNFYRNSKLYQ